MSSSEKAQALLGELEGKLGELVASDQWTAALECAARFHRYSFGNVCLILRQRPDATRVAGFQTWRSLGRYVRKGEKGIAILAPCVYKCRCEPRPGETCARCLGRGKVIGGFRVEHVFDVSQTDGTDLPDVRPVHLAGVAAPGLWEACEQLAGDLGFAVSVGELAGMPTAANGVCIHDERRIELRAGLGEAQTVRTFVHELAHALLHGPEYTGPRDVAEVEAESVAYVVTSALGMEPDGYSLPYVAGWAASKPDAIQKTGERIVRTARKILERVDALEDTPAAECAA